MILTRHKTKVIKIGNLLIGGNNPVAIQSMAKFKTSDVERTARQIKELQDAGCEIIRVAVKDSADAAAIKKLKRCIKIPIVADIHFNWKLAIESIENGADKIRLNPGNIQKDEEIKQIISALKDANIPLRIGLNSGSVQGAGSKKVSMPGKLVESALDYIKRIEKLRFYNLVISLKANNVTDTVEAYKKIAKQCNYPLHLGVTATGSPSKGVIKSSIAIGALLLEGIGDTIRVSLTEPPVKEVEAARCILEAVGARKFGPDIISCPTCGRCEVNLAQIVEKLEEKLLTSNKPIKVAVMGCVVNGPGEAVEADIGVAFGKKEGMLFKKGKAAGKVSFKDCVKILLNEMEKING